MNSTIRELCVDPAKAYADHREAYEQTGDMGQLRMMLEYVHEER